MKRYIGETERKLKERIKEHIGYANNQIIKMATGEHFNLPSHFFQNMKFTIIERIKKQDLVYRQERETDHILNFY